MVHRHPFMQKATQISRHEKISQTEAMRRLAHEEPELYASFRAAEARRGVHFRVARRVAS